MQVLYNLYTHDTFQPKTLLGKTKAAEEEHFLFDQVHSWKEDEPGFQFGWTW